MILDRENLVIAELGARFAGQDPERPVGLVPARASRDLCHLGNGQPAPPFAIELVEAREGNMTHVEVETHANGVGGDDIVDLTRLEHFNLRISRLR